MTTVNGKRETIERRLWLIFIGHDRGGREDFMGRVGETFEAHLGGAVTVPPGGRKGPRKLCWQARAAVFIMACLIVVRRSTVHRNFSGNSARPRE